MKTDDENCPEGFTCNAIDCNEKATHTVTFHGMAAGYLCDKHAREYLREKWLETNAQRHGLHPHGEPVCKN